MATSDVSAINVQKGEVLRVKDWLSDVTVRDVHVVLHMDNGMDLVVAPETLMQRVEP